MLSAMASGCWGWAGWKAQQGAPFQGACGPETATVNSSGGDENRPGGACAGLARRTNHAWDRGWDEELPRGFLEQREKAFWPRVGTGCFAPPLFLRPVLDAAAFLSVVSSLTL